MHARTAEIQVLLEGVDLPASKDELIGYAREQDGGSADLSLLRRLPDREFKSLDEVGEMLAPVRAYSRNDSPLPHEESGEPPGGDHYVEPAPVPGQAPQDAPSNNPPKKQIEEQTKRQNAQQERQKKQLGEEEED